MRLGDFCVNCGVIKADSGGVRGEIAEVNFVNPGPVDCTQAHGAGFAGSVEIAASKFEAAKPLAGLANRQHFSVRGGIVRGRDLIYTFGYDLAFLHDDTTERPTAPGTDVFEGELYGAGHENVVRVAWFRHCVIVKRLPNSATRAGARQSVNMDSFAAAGFRTKYKRRREVRKVFLMLCSCCDRRGITTKDTRSAKGSSC